MKLLNKINPLILLIVFSVICLQLFVSVGGKYLGHAAAEQVEQKSVNVPSVEVVTTRYKKVRKWSEFSGRLSAVDSSEVRPRVSGVIDKVYFTEGAIVNAGDELFLIDPRPFEASVANWEARLASALSKAKLAKSDLERNKKLIEQKIISESAFEAQENVYKTAVAAVRSCRASLREAQLQLEYAHVVAPISGRISRAELTVGNFVQAGASAPVLATIIDNDKLYAEFDVDETTLLDIKKQNEEEASLPVTLVLNDNKKSEYLGRFHSFDNHLNVESGTIRARATVDNTDGILLPGMFVNVKLGSASLKNVLMVPERAIGTNQSQKYVYVVTEDNKVEYRPVILGEKHVGDRIILAGIDEGNKVIVNGLHKIRPAMNVEPLEISERAVADDVVTSLDS